jgi:hypothetical protein
MADMKKTLFAAALIVAGGSFGLNDVAHAHGGQPGVAQTPTHADGNLFVSGATDRSTGRSGLFRRIVGDGEPIEYLFFGIGSGDIGGQDFSGSFEIRLLANTADIMVGSSVLSVVGPSNIQITTFPRASIGIETRVFSNLSNNAVGFSGPSADLVDLFDPAFAGYLLDTSLGPIFEEDPRAVNQFNNIPTSLGILNFDEIEEVTFQAILALALDFETEDDFLTPLANGQAITSPPKFGRLVSINGLGPHTYGAAIFDSTPGGPNTGGSDPDLMIGQGNILILQENQQQSVPGIYDDPDDAQLGGTIVFEFANPVELLSVDLIDICPGLPVQDVTVTLFDQASNTRTYFVPGGWTNDLFFDGPPGFDTLDLTTLNPQPGFLTTASASETSGFDAAHVVRLEVLLASSGALDNLIFIPGPNASAATTPPPGPSGRWLPWMPSTWTLRVKR